jgi:hypothetical protein
VRYLPVGKKDDPFGDHLLIMTGFSVMSHPGAFTQRGLWRALANVDGAWLVPSFFCLSTLIVLGFGKAVDASQAESTEG